jgi:poly(3-hydroxyalkanoate) synthetase
LSCVACFDAVELDVFVISLLGRSPDHDEAGFLVLEWASHVVDSDITEMKVLEIRCVAARVNTVGCAAG